MSLKIFIAQTTIYAQPDLWNMVGLYSPSNNWISLVNNPDGINLQQVHKEANKLQKGGSDVMPVLGQQTGDTSIVPLPSNGEKFLNSTLLCCDKTEGKRVTRLVLNGKPVTEEILRTCMFIEFDAKQLSKSLYFKDNLFRDDIVEFLLRTCDIAKSCSPDREVESRKYSSKSLFVSFCGFLGYAASFLGCLRRLRVAVLEQFCSPPAVLVQLKRKHKDCDILCRQLQSDPDGSCQLRVKNMLVRNLVDIALGLCLMWLFVAAPGSLLVISNTFTEMGQKAAQELQTLLHWMMGVPAGLKLNSQLDQFLGKFFLYHIYLWKAYLNVLRPFLPSLLWYTLLSGCLGLSVQLALLQDLLSMMTLHIYCFYVYAARLYNFQMSTLSSLWRLFRGKKWNALRQRVDTVEYDVNQLFVGTLLFTVLLFLLPTTALYYVIFLCLRAVVLLIQGSVYAAISVINNCPLYLFILRIFSHQTVTNVLEFIVVKRTDNQQPLCLQLQLKAASWGQLLAEGQMAGIKSSSVTWGNLLRSVLVGRLIYPWIDKVSSNGKD